MFNPNRSLSVDVKYGYRYIGQHWLWIVSGVFVLIIGIILSLGIYVYNQQLVQPRINYDKVLTNQKLVVPVFYTYSGVQKQFTTSLNAWQPTNPKYLQDLNQNLIPLRLSLQSLIDAASSSEQKLIEPDQISSQGVISQDILRSIQAESSQMVSLIDFQACIGVKQIQVLNKLQEVSKSQLQLPETPKTEDVANLYTSITKSYSLSQLEIDNFRSCFGGTRSVELNPNLESILERTKTEFASLAATTQSILDSINAKDETRYNQLLDELSQSTPTPPAILVTTIQDWLGTYLDQNNQSFVTIEKQLTVLQNEVKSL